MRLGNAEIYKLDIDKHRKPLRTTLSSPFLALAYAWTHLILNIAIAITQFLKFLMMREILKCSIE